MTNRLVVRNRLPMSLESYTVIIVSYSKRKYTLLAIAQNLPGVGYGVRATFAILPLLC